MRGAVLLRKRVEPILKDRRGEFAHPFLRATFYRWAERWEDMESDARVVLSVGDVHVENFGTWAIDGPD